MDIEVCKSALKERYRFVGEIGQGGMGKVYRAQDTQLDRQVAIKIPLPPDGAGEKWQKIITRFRREGRTLAKLSDPGIMQVYDLGNAGGLPFMISEWIDGQSLLRFPKPWSAAAIRFLARDLCKALAHAHESGVIHRDIKPANILMRADGSPVLIDFGIARFVNDDPLTQTGTVLGTLVYLAPELMLKNVTDAAIDQYSLGSVLYELATGETWIQGETVADIVQGLMRGNPADILAKRPDFDPQVAQLIHRMLCREPRERFASMIEATQAWDHLIENGAPRVLPPPPYSSKSDPSTLPTDHLPKSGVEQTIAYQGDTPPPEVLASSRAGTRPAPPSMEMPVNAPNTAAVETLLSRRKRLFRYGFLLFILMVGGLVYGAMQIGLIGQPGQEISEHASLAAEEGLHDGALSLLEPGLTPNENLKAGHEAYERGAPKEGILYYKRALEGKPRLKTDKLLLEHLVESMANGDLDASQLLKTYQSPRATQLMVTRTEGPGYQERERTIRLLQSIGHERKIDYGKVATLTLRDGPDCESRLHAIKIVDQLSYRRAIPELKALLNATAWELRFPVVCFKEKAESTLKRLEALP